MYISERVSTLAVASQPPDAPLALTITMLDPSRTIFRGWGYRTEDGETAAIALPEMRIAYLCATDVQPRDW